MKLPLKQWQDLIDGDCDGDGYYNTFECPGCGSTEVAHESGYSNPYITSDDYDHLGPEFECGDCGATSD